MMSWRAILLLLWFFWGSSPGLGATPLVLSEASATVTVDGVTHRETVTLPYHWDHLHRGRPGVGSFDLAFTLAPQLTGPYALYFVRLGNAYEVWLNGTLLEQRGDLQRFDGENYAQVPRIVAIPARLLQKDNRIQIRIRADSGRRAGVPTLLLGPDTEIERLYRREYGWRVTGSLVVVVLSLLVGLTALALWLTQTDASQPQRLQRDPLYLYASLAEFSWALRVGAVLVEAPPLPWPVWGALNVMALGAWACCMMVFCGLVAGWRNERWLSWLRRGLGGLLASGGLAAFASLNWQLPWLLTLWYGLLALVALPFSVYYLWSTLQRPGTMQLIVAAALALNALVGLRDWAVFRFGDAFGSDTLMRYSSVLFGLTLGGIVVSRFRRASAQARDLLENLARRVAQRELELQQSYAWVEQLGREQARAAERARILRDMHDGVGSHISAAIRQLQSGRASPAELLQTLRDSLDQLKLSIDAMHLPVGDVTALLANLRYRLEPRLAASDIELQWAVDLLEPLERLDAHAMRHLQFMVFEALSNVLQHAQASVVRIEAGMAADGVSLRVIDNGRGFDVQAPPRKGLLSLRERAGAVGARLALHSAPGRTVVDIRIPR